jgi:hypothetical protein
MKNESLVPRGLVTCLHMSRYVKPPFLSISLTELVAPTEKHQNGAGPI